MPKKYSEMTPQEKVKYFTAGIRIIVDRAYPIIDSDTGLAVPHLEGRYFEREIDYTIQKKDKIAVPVNWPLLFMMQQYQVSMSEETAKRWLLTVIFRDRWSYEYNSLQLEHLVLGDEGNQEIHTLKAKGRVYCRK